MKIDEPETKTSRKESASLSKKSDDFRWTTKFSTSNFVLAIVFGVALPVVTILVEVFSGMCANVFFDPIPSYYHLILISFVLFGNLFVILSIRKKKINNYKIVSFINSCTIGMTLFYSIIFLPLLPVGMIGIWFFGLGFLPLSPLISLIVAIVLRKKYSRFIPQIKLPSCWRVIVAICLIFILLDIPKIITCTGIQMAAGKKQSTEVNGIKLLRRFGDEKNTFTRMLSARTTGF